MTKIDLSAHIAALRKKEAANPTPVRDAILFWGTFQDKQYLPLLKGCVGAVTTHLRLDEVTTIAQVKMGCKAKHVNRIISTSIPLLKKLLYWDKRAAPSLDDYAGSHFILPDSDIEVVFIKPIKHLATVPFGKFMATRLITKLTKPEKWYKPTEFKGYHLLTPDNEGLYYSNFEDAFLISVDIETLREHATIRCLSYTGFWYEGRDGGTIVSDSVVLPLDSVYALSIMRKWNLLSAPKVLQNGKYDVAYFARYNAPLYNYLYDTAHLFHSWYSELPKDLGFLNSFFIREAVYWKDLAETSDLSEYYKYNALDTWGTGNAFLAMLLEAPEYAIQNYLLEFPLVFPCHLAEMTGIERDMDKMEAARAEQQEIIDKHTASLNKILSIPEGSSFNVNSPPQMKSLLKLLGCGDFKSADANHLKKARFRHPFNARLINLVTETRKARKLISTYITAGKEFHRLDGTGNRILYALNPHGTDTSRLASREHHFWCGLQIQNIPRDGPTKTTFVADPDFYLAEVDLEQAESRDTAYISGDPALIDNVENSPDFHCANASAFFGIPFDELYDVVNHVKLNVPIRNIAKNVNHGANYNMGAYVLIDTMGEENIVKAKHLLELPRFWSYVQVADYLLEGFHKTYPMIKATFYEGVVNEIGKTRMLKSMAVHYMGSATPVVYEQRLEKEGSWTRYCFGDPSKSKSSLNSYIAHPPQSLNAQTLNKGWLKVFHEIAMHEEHSRNFKLCAQIHDSILFQWRKGHSYLCDMVKDRMEVPVTICAYDNVVRTFTVPAGIKAGKIEGSPARYWSDTE
jgi:DNA polymerase I-like protein with 3'-5' exonuclease and polymerase domains